MLQPQKETAGWWGKRRV